MTALKLDKFGGMLPAWDSGCYLMDKQIIV